MSILAETMAGRRLSEGLHQAIEAKEGVHIQAESQTLASTTFQKLFPFVLINSPA